MDWHRCLVQCLNLDIEYYKYALQSLFCEMGAAFNDFTATENLPFLFIFCLRVYLTLD